MADGFPQPSGISRQQRIAFYGVPRNTVGVWTPTFGNAANFPQWLIVSDGAVNDQATWDFVCLGGTYQLDIIWLPFTNRGILTFLIDGVSVGTLDEYSAVLVNAQMLSLTGIAIGGGAHTFTVSVLSKNGASSSFVCSISEMILTKTA